MTQRESVCILAPVHPYYDIRVFQKEAKSLARAGYDVHLLARSDDPVVEDGVKVLPLRYGARWQRFLLQPWFAWKVLASRARVVHLHNPDTLPIGFALKALGKKVVYDTHENYRVLMLDKEWLPRPLRAPLAVAVDGLERLAGRVFDQVIVTQTAQAEQFGPDTVVIENPPISEGPLIEQALALGAQQERGTELRAVYIGLSKEDRGLFKMIEAMERLNQTTPARLWITGPVANPELLERARQLPGWQYVDHLGIISLAEAYARVVAADVGLALFQPWGDNQLVNINKLFEYALFGTPVVCSDFPAWRGYLDGSGFGHFVDPTSVEAIVEALRWVAEHRDEAKAMGQAGQRFVRERYNWELESRKLLAIYDRLTT